MARPAEAPQPSLPPREFWLLKPGEKLDTPTDSRGIVDIGATIAAVKSAIVPEYVWLPGLDVHHFQNPADLYPHVVEAGHPNPAVFRNLPVHRGLLPIEFHHFLHEVMLPPPTPPEEVMHYRIESWNVAASLFKKARQTIELERKWRRRQAYVAQNPGTVAVEFDGRDVVGEEIMQDRFERDFRGLDRHLERNSLLPPEFQLFDSSAPLPQIAADLGKVAVPRSVLAYRLLAA